METISDRINRRMRDLNLRAARIVEHTGTLVLAKVAGADEITFKKYVRDAGREWLMPLNPNYPAIHEPFKVLAVFQHALVF